MDPRTSPMQVVYLGLNEFPFGLAETQKVTLIARGLVYAGCGVTVVSRCWGSETWEGQSALPPRGMVQGIRYINASGAMVRPDGWFIRKVRKLAGYLLEVVTLVRLRLSGQLDAAIISAGSAGAVAYFRIISKVLGFPIVMQIAELRGSALRTQSFGRRLNACLLDTRALRWVDGLLPISEVLVRHVEETVPGVPFYRDRVLVDFSKFDGMSRHSGPTFLLFAGYLAYVEVVKFLLRVFDRLRNAEGVQLVLVVNGSDEMFAELHRGLEKCARRDRVTILSKLGEPELFRLYADAYALLIPLRPTLQDAARFPHKVGEYCASRRPIITTNFGEIKAYFRHGENAYIAEAYEVEGFARVVDEALADPCRADAIGLAGRDLAEREFDYLRFGPGLKHFIGTLLPNGERRP